MDITSWLVLCMIIINIAGWVYTKFNDYAKLEQKVKTMGDIINNGLVHEVAHVKDDVSDVKVNLSNLEGKVDTFIDIQHKKKR